MQRTVRIRTQIFFIVLMSIVPTVIIALYSAFFYQQTYLKEKKAAVTNLCDGFTNELRLVVRNTEDLFRSIAQTQAVQDDDEAALEAYLANLMNLFPGYSALLAADIDGNVIASGVNRSGYNVSDRDYFKYAKRTGGFTIGSYVVSRSTGIRSLSFALPVTTRSGRIIMLIAAYSLDHISRDLSLSRLSADSTLEIFDYYGQRLFSSVPGGADSLGRPVSRDLFARILDTSQRSAERIALEGKEYLCASNSFSRNGLSVYVTVRSPYRFVERNSLFPAIRIMLVMAMACLFSFGLSMWLARRLIVSRIERLTDYTQALARGDLTVRTETSLVRDEFSALMDAFNAMAGSLEKRNLSNLRVIEEKESLLKELQKRISDNLQILSSMVNLQIEHAAEASVRASLLNTESRIMALSLVYETIFRYSEVEQVQMHRYCNGLFSYLTSLYVDVGKDIRLTVTGVDVALSTGQAIPVALILNELVSNSLLHAFRDRTEGTIGVSLDSPVPRELLIRIWDDGVGFDSNAHLKDSLGYEMIEALVEQICGKMSVNSSPSGTSIEIQFPLA